MAPKSDPMTTDSDDGFEIVEKVLPTRSKAANNVPESCKNATVDIHWVPDSPDVLVSIKPPQKPLGNIEHVSCDVVLVIDISGSMNASADLLNTSSDEKQESSGLSILDLVKHASRTILESLNAHDRLAVVTFSNSATVVQELLKMSEIEKKNTWSRIEKLTVKDCTNLWSGIREGLKLFENTERIGNVQRMFVLTDGVPNHMCPSQGYVKKLRPILKEIADNSGTAPTISTFGFGYYLRSALLRSIAEVGSGYYGFIPDAGMIGTVFVHAVANLFSTFATDTVITLTCSENVFEVIAPTYFDYAVQNTAANISSLRLGNIQYGQSRDIVFKIRAVRKSQPIKATLSYRSANNKVFSTSVLHKPGNQPPLRRSMIDYHLSRHDICSFLAEFSIRNLKEEHIHIGSQLVQNKAADFMALVSKIESRKDLAEKANDTASTELQNLIALLLDLRPAEADSTDLHGAGQISLALQAAPKNPAGQNVDAPPAYSPSQPRGSTLTTTYYDRWGKHYIPSILHAHMFQVCVTFKDPGPLRYGVDSPLFIKCRDKLDSTFDDLPAPEPSLIRPPPGHPRWAGGAFRTPYSKVRMSRWNSVSNPCFGAKNLVYMATEEDNVYGMKVEEVRVGDFVWTKAGMRAVEAIVRTDVSEQTMYEVRDRSLDNDQAQALTVTPWHPVIFAGLWRFPTKVMDCFPGVFPKSVLMNESIYSFMLEKDDNPDAHMMRINGHWSVTLGHGVVTGDTTQDARVHPFFGNYDLVQESIERLEKDNCGRRLSGGVAKVNEDCSIGLAYKFLRPDEVDKFSTQDKEKWKASL